MQNFSNRALCLLIVASIFILGGCKKTYEIKKEKAQSGDNKTYSADVTISIQEIFAQLPQTVMYNLKDEANFLIGSAEWIYTEEYLAVKIPVTEGGFSYIYAVKPYNNPDGGVHVYGVQFLRDEGNESDEFTGRQMWINFQDWHVYGVRFDEGQITNHLTPVKLADPGWETCAMENKRLYMGPDGKIAVQDEVAALNGLITPLSSPYDCPGEGSFWKSLGNFFAGTVVLSDYYIDQGADHYWFTFTTMATLYDGSHPVAGNRRFGILPHPSGGWQFYIGGVDRMWEWSTLIPALNLDEVGFETADVLWEKIQDNVIDYIENNQGSATYFPQRSKKVRIKWEGAVKDFLQGHISLDDLRTMLN